jgi:hypothetical protein
MPKDEFDPEDPMELCGVGLLTEEDTSEPMTECFIEEFLRLGYNARQILALFRNRHYTGMKMVLQNRGEDFVRAKIVEVFGWWRRHVDLPVAARDSGNPSQPAPDAAAAQADAAACPSLVGRDFVEPCKVEPSSCQRVATDPTGASRPDLNF